MEILEAIKTALPVFAEHKRSNYQILQQALLDAGISLSITLRLLEFMPLAFGRVFMSSMGIKFQDHYTRRNPETGQDKVKRLLDEPVYRESFKAASFIVAQKAAGEAFQSVAFRSPEFAAVNDLMNKGSKPKNLVLSQPMML